MLAKLFTQPLSVPFGFDATGYDQAQAPTFWLQQLQVSLEKWHKHIPLLIEQAVMTRIPYLVAIEQIGGTFIGADIGRIANQVIEQTVNRACLLHRLRIKGVDTVDGELQRRWPGFPIRFISILSWVNQEWQALDKQVDGREVTGKRVEIETNEGTCENT